MTVSLEKFEQFWLKPVDVRPYALLRIGYAFAGLFHLMVLWPVRHQFFAETGMIDHSLNPVYRGYASIFSVFRWPWSELEVNVIFGLAALTYIFLGLGWFSRFCAVLAFLWACSFSDGIHPAFSGQDDAFRAFGFILMISPMGNKTQITAPAYGLWLWQWQVAMIYFTTSGLKLIDPFWQSGSFLPFFLMSIYSRFSDINFAQYETLLKVPTYLALFTECSVPFLLWFRKTRVLGFILGWGLHGFIGITSNVPDFSLVMMMSYFAFLKKEDLDWLRQISSKRLS